ncbi:hypothetical protein DM819_17885 [Pseudomonas hunanensis]|uniref:Uncharacterized protein n=1 Tax=Pseudomonas hunanensis TaxID=1247546 RepID=A0ABD6N1D4_9PSED|nr:hypothetical protein [Pseudomonas hunanensis]
MCARADTAGEGFALDRRQASSHRYCTWLGAGAVGVGAGLPAIGTQSGPRTPQIFLILPKWLSSLRLGKYPTSRVLCHHLLSGNLCP